MEGTATWVEDEVYDSINDNYQFLSDSPIRYPRRAADYSVDLARYGSFVFFRYVAERLGSRTRHTPVLGLRRRPREPVLAPGDPRRDGRPKHQLDEPVHAVRELEHAPRRQLQRARGLPASGADAQQDPLQAARRRPAGSTVNLPHMSSSTIRIAPHSSLSTRKRVLIEIDGPNTSHGTNALIQRRYRSGKVTHSMIPLNGYGNARLLRDFNRASISSMYLVVSNTSTAMTDCGEVLAAYGGPKYSCSRPRHLRQRRRPSRSAPACVRWASPWGTITGPVWLCLETTEIRGDPHVPTLSDFTANTITGEEQPLDDVRRKGRPGGEHRLEVRLHPAVRGPGEAALAVRRRGTRGSRLPLQPVRQPGPR